MSGALANCKKCTKLFQKRLSDLCPECIKREDEQFTTLYRTLQASAPQGGMDIQVLSGQVGIPVEEIERFYLEGRLSTAGIYLKFHCLNCGMMMSELNRRGRFCINCSEATASQAGVAVRSFQELNRAQEREKLRQEYLNLLKKDSRAARQFGRNHRLM